MTLRDVEEKDESLSTLYYKEFSSQLDNIARKLKTPVVTFVLVMILPLLCSLGVSMISGPRGIPVPNNSTFGGSIDFPTLMSIEASFERVVDSAAGGSELARSLKQSEMAVADLSTVVKYSDLNCRETLSTRLEQFAIDARDNVVGLLEFSAKVGGVLDEYRPPVHEHDIMLTGGLGCYPSTSMHSVNSTPFATTTLKNPPSSTASPSPGLSPLSHPSNPLPPPSPVLASPKPSTPPSKSSKPTYGFSLPTAQ